MGIMIGAPRFAAVIAVAISIVGSETNLMSNFY